MRLVTGLLRAYQRAIACDPDCADAHCNLGSVYFNQDRLASAGGPKWRPIGTTSFSQVNDPKGIRTPVSQGFARCT